MGFKVYKHPCKNCLLTKNKIVSDERKKDILSDIMQQQSYFVCHKSSMSEEGGQGVCCKKFYDDMGHFSQMIRIAERLNAVEFIDQPDNKKLPTWDEMNSKPE